MTRAAPALTQVSAAASIVGVANSRNAASTIAYGPFLRSSSTNATRSSFASALRLPCATSNSAVFMLLFIVSDCRKWYDTTMIGERLGKWVIFKELGRGGMGR